MHPNGNEKKHKKKAIAVLIALAGLTAARLTDAASVGFFDSTTGRAIPNVRIEASEKSGLATITAPGYTALDCPKGTFSGRYPVQVFLDPTAPPTQLSASHLQSLRQEDEMVIAGYVVDDETGQPLAGALINVSTGQSASADETGFFQINVSVDKNRNGELTDLVFSRPGYEVQARHNVKIERQGDAIYTIRMRVGRAYRDYYENNRAPEPENVTPSIESEANPQSNDESRPSVSQSPAAPQAVSIPNSIRVLTSSGVVVTESLESYCKKVLPAEWIPSWGTLNSNRGMNALRAGAIAIRTYAIGYVYNPLSSSYDICGTTSCQVYDSSKVTTITNTAVDETVNMVMVNSSGQITYKMTEYSAENNSPSGACGDGYTGHCVSDPICAGLAQNGHGRGMCQYGSARWASGWFLSSQTPHGYGAQTYQWIVSHYYPSFSLTTGTPTGTLSVNVTSPNGGESWAAGSTRAITWTTTGNTSALSYYKVAYSVDGGTTYTNVVEQAIAGSPYNWTIPSGISSNQARIRVRALDANGNILAFDASNSNFSLGSSPTPSPTVAPQKATNPNPSNSATGQGVNLTLSWSNGGGATSYKVYFGTDSTPDSGEYEDERAGTTFTTPTLNAGTKYYWRIDATNAGVSTTGDVWNFTTTANPTPAPTASPTPTPTATPIATPTPGPARIVIAHGAVIALTANANGMLVAAENAGGSPLVANRTSIGRWEQFQILDLGNGYIALRSLVNGLYVCAENAGGSPLIANRTTIGTWEQFQAVDAGSGNFGLIARANGKYVCAENAGAGSLIANRTVMGGWEQFRMVFLPAVKPVNVTTSFQSVASGAYICAESGGGAPLVANRSSGGSWEQFQLIDVGNGNVAIRSLINGQLVTADNYGAAPLIANRSTPGTWEQFQLLDVGGGTVALRAVVNGQYVSVGNAGQQLVANRSFVGQTEQFILNVSLRAVVNESFVSTPNNGANPLIANRPSIGVPEQFQVVNTSDSYFGLKAKVNGMYVCAENYGKEPLVANRPSIGAWEQFQWIVGGNGNVALKAAVNGQFVCAENGGNSPLVANRPSASTWEQFH
jgi:hypothetical protein